MTLEVNIPPVFRPLTRPARHKGAYGGRGSGKSTFFGIYLVLRSLQQPGLRSLCVREIQNSIDTSSKKMIEDQIKRLRVESLFRVKRAEIEAPGGGSIVFKGMQNHTADAVKSMEGIDICWVEEAHAISQTSLDILIPTIRKDGSELWYSWNPGSPKDAVDAFLRADPPPPDSVVVRANWQDNPYLPNAMLAELEWMANHDREKYLHVWEGEYQIRSEAQVFHNYRVEDFTTPEDARFYFGGDWGFAKDPTTLVRCFIEGRTLYIDHEVYKVGVEIDHLPFLFGGARDEELRKLNRDGWASLSPEAKLWQGVPGSRQWPIIADSARPETISHMQRHGFPNITAAKKGAGSVEEGVEFLRNFEIVIHPRCTHVKDEFDSYSYQVDRRTEEVLPKLEDKHNHCIDATRYAIENVRRGDWGLLFSGGADADELRDRVDALKRRLSGNG